ncbi:MAG TPA: hypothetical protein VMM38_15675 [Aridibacter sp.]|nr:hypothetical protein [Aridibacter sp.]
MVRVLPTMDLDQLRRMLRIKPFASNSLTFFSANSRAFRQSLLIKIHRLLESNAISARQTDVQKRLGNIASAILNSRSVPLAPIGASISGLREINCELCSDANARMNIEMRAN